MKLWLLIVAGSIALRVGLLVYGAHMDKGALKYTDIDYEVFTGAAECLLMKHAWCEPAQGQFFQDFPQYALGSPYSRETYRYTPLLALVMTPNAWYAAFGKLLFALCDILVGLLLYRILLHTSKPFFSRTACATAVGTVWLLNPIVANISTRGSAESLVGLSVVLTLFLVLRRSFALAGIVYAFSIHLKIFPVIYAPSLFMWLLFADKALTFKRRFLDLFVFGVFTALSLAGLTYAVYYVFGQPFIDHTYLYHVERSDHRHNFSLYYYPYYLYNAVKSSPVFDFLPVWIHFLSQSYMAFVPQLILTALAGFLYGASDLAYTWFIQTFIFVTFNKVCTSQYFLWYLWLLPVAIPRLRHLSLSTAATYVGVWVAGQAIWLFQAYKLEIQGESNHQRIWVSSVIFFIINAHLVTKLLEAYSDQS